MSLSNTEVSVFCGCTLLGMGLANAGPTPAEVFVVAGALLLGPLLWWLHAPTVKVLRRWWKRLVERRQFAALLHASNAWHCGCAPCVAERVAMHGDVSRRVIPGPWPVVVEKWKPTEAEWLSTWRKLK